MSKRDFKKHTYYHIYNRGNTKEWLFFCEQDLERFGNTVTRYLVEFPLIKIYVWAFLPNHFHFLVSEVSESGLEKNENFVKCQKEERAAEYISSFMRKIQQAYAMYFNSKYAETVKHGKKAPVFEGNFKAKEITDESYLARVAYYIRYNAVKHEIVENVYEWDWAGVSAEFELEIDEEGLGPEFDPSFE